MDLIVALTAGFTLFAGVTTFLLARRDLRTGPAVTVAVVAGLLTGLGFMSTVYLAVAAYLGAVVLWQLARHFRIGGRRALLVGTGAFAVALAGAVTVMSVALSTM
ncbi:hypothetical protein [Actinoplanes sp. NPDC051494]|uniref:hypothetical protein n=1 Tax=Actinoplanes sp. NPDC051494 TaxID=3363907 RepID=UPI0037A73CE4